jgi:hypothetical protein
LWADEHGHAQRHAPLSKEFKHLVMVFGPKNCFAQVQNFEIPSHHCGKMYGGLACKAWLVVQASLNFGEEQTMVNLRARA